MKAFENVSLKKYSHNTNINISQNWSKIMFHRGNQHLLQKLPVCPSKENHCLYDKDSIGVQIIVKR